MQLCSERPHRPLKADLSSTSTSVPAISSKRDTAHIAGSSCVAPRRRHISTFITSQARATLSFKNAMSAPNDGYGGYPPAPQPHGQQSPYPDQAQGYEAASSPPPSAAGAGAADHGRKKKRAYAAQAFEVGQGGNVAAGGQLPVAGAFGAPQPLTPGYGGYPTQDSQAVPAYGGAPAYGVPQPGVPAAGAAGYQAPEPYYPSAAPGAPAGVAAITSGLSGMQLGAGAGTQPAQPAAAQARPVALNQLYPTDLLNQPFNVSELDLPPPPIILPPNVSTSFPPSVR